MNSDTIRINVTLPALLVKTLTEIAGPRKRSLFIAEALQHKIAIIEKQKMEASMVEGYTAMRKEGNEITNEFRHTDIEGWDEY